MTDILVGGWIKWDHCGHWAEPQPKKELYMNIHRSYLMMVCECPVTMGKGISAKVHDFA